MKAIFIAATLLFTVSAFGQSDPPNVGISVSIEAPLYTNELGDVLQDVEEKLDNFVQDFFSDKAAMRFVRWNLSEGGEEYGLRLVIEEESSSLGPEIRVRFLGTVDGIETDLSQQNLDHFNQMVFDVFSQKFAQDPDRLETELQRRLEGLMNDSFIDALKESFLRDVTLTSMIEVDANGRRLIIPLRFSAISPDRESTLRVEFTSTQIGDPRDGSMSLNLAGKVKPDHFDEDGLDCEISSFKYPAITFSSAEAVLDEWSRIVDVLAEENLTHTALFMENYIPGPPSNTSNGLVLDEPLP